jgi:undecaprenyl-diphosphatase
MPIATAATVLRSRLDVVARWDASVLTALARIERRGLDSLMRALTRAGDTPGWVVHGLVLLALGAVGVHALTVMAVAAGFGTLASQLAKRAFRRRRPTASIPGFVARTADPDPFSFPSGHSTVAFAIATAAVATSPLLGAVEVALAASIAGSRLYLGAHNPVDVLGGMTLGLACGLAAFGLLG